MTDIQKFIDDYKNDRRIAKAIDHLAESGVKLNDKERLFLHDYEEKYRVINAVLEDMNEIDKTILASCLDGYSYSEIAGTVNHSKSSVAKHYRKAIKGIEKFIIQYVI